MLSPVFIVPLFAQLPLPHAKSSHWNEKTTLFTATFKSIDSVPRGGWVRNQRLQTSHLCLLFIQLQEQQYTSSTLLVCRVSCFQQKDIKTKSLKFIGHSCQNRHLSTSKQACLSSPSRLCPSLAFTSDCKLLKAEMYLHPIYDCPALTFSTGEVRHSKSGKIQYSAIGLSWDWQK